MAIAYSLACEIESGAVEGSVRGAFLRSVASGAPVYDTLFVELAARTGCPLATFDRAMLKTFLDIAVRPRKLAED